jgi:hypothetical protein
VLGKGHLAFFAGIADAGMVVAAMKPGSQLACESVAIGTALYIDTTLGAGGVARVRATAPDGTTLNGFSAQTARLLAVFLYAFAAGAFAFQIIPARAAVESTIAYEFCAADNGPRKSVTRQLSDNSLHHLFLLFVFAQR